MKEAPTHIIHKLNVETNVPDMAVAKKLERNSSAFIHTQLIPLIEKMFAEEALENLHYRFTDITINVVVKKGEDIEQAVKKALTSQLRQELQRTKPSDEQTNKNAVEAVAEKGGAVIITAEATVMESFLFFLVHGYLPWWSSSKGDPFTTTLLTEAVTQHEADFSRQLMALLKSSPVAVDRLVVQFPDALLVFFAGLLLPLPVFQPLMQAQKELEKGGIVIGQSRALHVFFWRTVFKKIAGHEMIATRDSTIAAPGAEQKSGSELKSPENRINKTITHIFQTRTVSNILADDNLRRADQQTEDLPTTMATEKNKSAVLKKKDSFPPQEGIIVANAGLVLLHAFLPTFFRATGLLTGENFGNKETRQTAVHLLHYLATGAEAAFEYGMPFEKYLTGLPADEPIDRFIKLTDEMKTEAGSLLQSAIGHWTKLGNTSPAGLQQTFLQRPGKLVQASESRHQLIVEQAATDVLLNYLPWSFSMVKLPWLPAILDVEWNNR